MSIPTSPTVTVTNTNDETTVVSQQREESPSPLPIPPPQSMSSLHDEITMSPHHSPIVSDDESITAYSRSNTPSPDSTIGALMQFITDVADRLEQPLRIVDQSMMNVITTRDRMIHRLSTADQPLTTEQRETLIQQLDEFTTEARNLGLPLIPQEIIDEFLERTHPHQVLNQVTTLDALVTAIARATTVSVATATEEEQTIVHPIGAPPTFTIQADENVLNISDSDDSRHTDTPGLPPNSFSQEFNLQNDENFDVRPPVITFTNRILEHYCIPTWEDTTMRRNYYHIWTLLTSWTFVNNYLHVLN